MALTKSNVKKILNSSGMIIETGNWTLSGGDTAGVLSADTTNGNPDIAEIFIADIRSSTATQAVTASKSASAPSYSISSAANDNGTYTFFGRAA